MMLKLYAALRAGNVPDDKAQEAAEEIAGYENRFTKLESALNLLKRMIGFNWVMTVAIISKLFVHWEMIKLAMAFSGSLERSRHIDLPSAFG